MRLTGYPNYSRHSNEVPHSAWHQELDRFEDLIKAQIDDSQNIYIDPDMHRQHGPPEWIRQLEENWLHILDKELGKAAQFLMKSFSRSNDSNSKEGSESKSARGKETREDSSKKTGPQNEIPSLASSLGGNKTVLQCHYSSIAKAITCLANMAELAWSYEELENNELPEDLLPQGQTRQDLLTHIERLVEQLKLSQQNLGSCLEMMQSFVKGCHTIPTTQTDRSDENHESVQTDSDETIAGDEDDTSASEE